MSLDFSFLLPPYTPVELPSRGKYYKNIPSLTEGIVYIREYAAPEEALLAHMNRDNVQLVLNSMLESCIRLDGFKVEDLTTEDAFYLLVWLRANSYGPIYDIEVSCPRRDCGIEDTYSVNLSELTINYLTDEDPNEPISVVGPKTQIKFEVNCMRRGTEVQAQKRTAQLKQLKGLYKGEISDLLKRAYSIRRVVMPNGEESTDKLEIEDLILRFLPANDSLVIDHAIDEFKHGVDVNIRLTCTSCNQEFFTVVPPGPSFFRPAGIRVENTRELVRTSTPPVEVRQSQLDVSGGVNTVQPPTAPRIIKRHAQTGESGA